MTQRRRRVARGIDVAERGGVDRSDRRAVYGGPRRPRREFAGPVGREFDRRQARRDVGREGRGVGPSPGVTETRPPTKPSATSAAAIDAFAYVFMEQPLPQRYRPFAEEELTMTPTAPPLSRRGAGSMSARESVRTGATRGERKREMDKRAKFHGSMPALVTPFKDGKFDETAFRALIDWQISAGSHGLVPVGMTGESPTLTHEEHRRVVDACIEEARGRVPVIAGAGSNNTIEAIEFARHAEKAGADAAW